jgi:hypothetical protein
MRRPIFVRAGLRAYFKFRQIHPAGALSSEAGTGLREGSASKQQTLEYFRFGLKRRDAIVYATSPDGDCDGGRRIRLFAARTPER